MSAIKDVPVQSFDILNATVMQYAAQGYITQRDTGDTVTLSRKPPFNWPLAIICLFVPVFGWIALLVIVIAAGRGHQVVTIRLQSPEDIDPPPINAHQVPSLKAPTPAYRH